MPGYFEMDQPLLEDQIWDQFEENHFPYGWKQSYLPRGRLRELITRSSIIQEFTRGRDRTPVDGSLIGFILTSAQKLLAITLIAGITSSRLHQTMIIFKRFNFTDGQLPVTSEDQRFPWPTLKWSVVEQRRFKDSQWMFLVRILRDDGAIKKIGNQEILPFRLVNEQQITGAFSDVWKVAIHEAHQERPMRMVRVKSDGAVH